MTPRELWLSSTWPFVAAHLPPRPARVLEIGCGSAGGFVPALRAAGYEAAGIDPEAPPGPEYHRTEFENYEPPNPVDVIVACTSLHHVADLDVVLAHVAAGLGSAGTLVVVEWAWEQFDEPTAHWCFERLPASDASSQPSWLHEQREHWIASGRSWPEYRAAWAAEEALHTVEAIQTALGAKFATSEWSSAPYFFADLDGVTEADERAAIETGRIQATGIHYVGTLR
ncbi:MAG: hypothetical protein DLM58_20040 [Pseudonocardiales bacterium]|nr:MAG: hypothetical protein DLM58_20040 [Pseudonocardiales bacterium]